MNSRTNKRDILHPGKKEPERGEGSNVRYVLIIDENIHHVELLTEILDRRFQPVIVHAADSFDAATRMVERVSYDLVFSDCVVANEQLLDRIVGIIQRSENAPFIVLMSCSDEAAAAALLQKGVAEILIKTKETLERLPEIISKHLRGKSGRAAKGEEALPPSKMHMIEELDRLAEETLLLSAQSKKGMIPSESQMRKILEIVSRLKKMIA